MLTFLRVLFRIRKWFVAGSPLNYAKMRRFNFTESKVVKKYGKKIQIKKIDGHPVYIFQPKYSRTLIWFHGGGYVRGPISLHFNRWLEMCEKTKSRGILIDYPKAPEFCHQDTKTVLEKFTNHFTHPSELYFVGDSAGGGLALSYALYLQKSGFKKPDAIFLFSPWLDLSFSQSNLSEYEERDAFVIQSHAHQNALAYAKGGSLQNEWISPFFTTEQKISFPVHIYSTPDEILHPAALEFKSKHPEIHLHLHDRLFHAWPILPLKESNQVIQEVIQIIRSMALGERQNQSTLDSSGSAF